MHANSNVVNWYRWYRSTRHLYLTLVSQIFHGPPFGYTLSTSNSDDLNITCSGMMILCWLKDRSWRWYLISLSRDRALPKPWGHPEIGDLKPIFAYVCRHHFRVMCVTIHGCILSHVKNWKGPICFDNVKHNNLSVMFCLRHLPRTLTSQFSAHDINWRGHQIAIAG